MITISCMQTIRASAADICASFIEPARLKRFWLAEASGPLAIGVPVCWAFLVPGARTMTTATRIEPGLVAFDWADGPAVTITTEGHDAGVDVRVTIDIGDAGPSAIANVIEGFTLVLSDLKLLLETGTSPGLVAAKAALLARQRPR